MHSNLTVFLALGFVFVAHNLMVTGVCADPVPWDSLPFTYVPLVQNGTGNLLPNADFRDGTAGWNAKGNVSISVVGGKNVLRMGARHDSAKASIQLILSASPSCLYQLSFRFFFAPAAKFDYQSDFPGLHGWFVPLSPVLDS